MNDYADWAEHARPLQALMTTLVGVGHARRSRCPGTGACASRRVPDWKRAAKIRQTHPARFLTVHGSGAVMRAAVAGRGASGLKLLAVTVLTRFDEQDLADMGYACRPADLVALRVRKAMEAGMAIRDGADYLVIGRQITRAKDPAAALRQVFDEIRAASHA